MLHYHHHNDLGRLADCGDRQEAEKDIDVDVVFLPIFATYDIFIS